MTRHARRASLLVAFSLLTSAATAHAECAWVLWSASSGAEGDRVWMTSTCGAALVRAAPRSSTS